MAKRRLNEKDVEELLTQYRSERRRLLFQLERVRQAIADLRNGDAPSEGGSKKKATRTSTTRRKPGRRKKRTITGGGYRLSNWDELVVKTITDRQQMLPKADLLAVALKWAKKNEPNMTEEEVSVKLTRVLQKLSGKRGVLGTYRSGLRRGYHYGLKEWFYSSTGALRRKHLDKLVLTNE